MSRTRHTEAEIIAVLMQVEAAGSWGSNWAVHGVSNGPRDTRPGSVPADRMEAVPVPISPLVPRRNLSPVGSGDREVHPRSPATSLADGATGVRETERSAVS
jgi:hypothetical protein